MSTEIYIARILYERTVESEESCPAVGLKIPEIAGLKELLGVEGAPEILSHYARFARARGGGFSGVQAHDWSAVESLTPYGFLAHLVGLGFTNIRGAAEILFKFHELLAEAGICDWRIDIDALDDVVEELLGLREQKFLFIEAETEEEARMKAEKIGEEREQELTNPYGDRVIWSFVGVIDVRKVEVKDGFEFFSIYFRTKGTED